jgi:hypothetical protein
LEAIHRQGYLAESGSVGAAQWTAETWRAAYSSPIGSTVIPLSAKCERTASGEIAMTLLVAANSLEFRREGENFQADLEIGIADRAADGGAQTNRAESTALIPAARWEELRNQAIAYQRQWKAAEGATSVRIVLRDARSGKYGTLDVALNRLGSPSERRP